MADGEWLLDTSILIDILRGYQPAREWVDSQAPNERFISVAVAATAVNLRLRLATLNLKHFAPFSDLQVEKPY